MQEFLNITRQMLVEFVAKVFQHDPTIVSEAVTLALGYKAASKEQIN